MRFAKDVIIKSPERTALKLPPRNKPMYGRNRSNNTQLMINEVKVDQDFYEQLNKPLPVDMRRVLEPLQVSRSIIVNKSPKSKSKPIMSPLAAAAAPNNPISNTVQKSTKKILEE